MKAMRLHAPQSIDASPLVLENVPDPTPDADEIVVRVRACGVCHTDLHIVEGDLAPRRLPVVPGHQAVGVVEHVGLNASMRWHVGDRVGVPWLHSACGVCRFCLRGNENLCDAATFTGWDVDGGYAERVLVRQSAVAIPSGFSDVQAAPLLCAGIIGYRALRLVGADRGLRLGLFGFGASAHVTLQVARHLGCEVLVFTRSEAHRELARSLGAAWTGQANERAPHPLDAAILFAPVGALVHDALRALDKGGTLALAGIHMSPIPETPYDLLWGERIVRSVANATHRDAADLMKLAAEIPVHTEVETFPLADANRALLAVKSSRIRGAAVLVID